MRLAIVTPEYAGVTTYTGGIGSQYARLAPELVRLGHEVSAVTLTPDVPRRDEREGVRLELVGEPRMVTLRPLAWAWESHRALRRLGPLDLVFACEYGGGAWRFAVARRTTPLVTNLQSSTIQIARTSEWLRRQRLLPVVLQQRAMERQQARRSDALVAPTRAILDWSDELWGLAKVPSEVVPNAADVAGVRALGEGVAPEAVHGEGPLVAYFGRLEVRKGVHVLVEAMREVWDRVPEARLVLIGGDNPWRGGSMSDHLRALAGPFESRLRMVGPWPPEQLFPALAAADVVVLPSLWENFATAALEAMALGSAMVVTSGTGFDEFIRPEKEALMVPQGDAAALSDAIQRLLKDPGLRGRLGGAAAESARRYDSSVVARRLAEVFESVSRTAA